MRGRGTLRWRTLAVVAGLILALGAAVRWYELGPEEGAGESAAVPAPAGAAGGVTAELPPEDHHADALARRFRQGVVMLHAREYEHAAVAFDRVLAMAPRMPEARVNMGFAMLGQGRAALARDHFNAAIELRPSQRNAYYGLAEALEILGDIPGALGAMRTFVHLSPPDDPFVRKARAALWEWQAAADDPSETGISAGPRGGG